MERHIAVCIKAVMMKAPSGRAVRSSDTCVLNPFDRAAMEAALRLKAEAGGRLTALSMGPESSAFVLFEALAQGFDKGILLTDPGFAGSDTLATARVLAAALKKAAPVDGILFGLRSADSDTGQVPAQVAVMLGLPFVSGVRRFDRESDGFRVERGCDGFRESYRLAFPGVFSVHPKCAEPRDAGLAGIESAFGQGSIERWSLTDLGLPAGAVGEAGSPTQLQRVAPANGGRRRCEFLEGDLKEQAQTIAKRLAAGGLIG